MSSESFIHLRCPTAYSLGEASIPPERIMELAKADGQAAIAVTDSNLMLGAVRAYRAAEKEGVRPIMGVEILVENDVTDPQEVGEDGQVNMPPPPLSKILLLAENEEGYGNIMALLSDAYTLNHVQRFDSTGSKADKAAIKQSWLRDDPSRVKGVIALSGVEGHDASGREWGEIPRALAGLYSVPDENGTVRETPAQRAKKSLLFYRSVFGDNFLLEVQRTGMPHETEIVNGMLRLSVASGQKAVATHSMLFENREDYFFNEALSSANDGKNLSLLSPGRKSAFTREMKFQTTAEMEELWSDVPAVLDNAREIAKRVNLTLDLNVNKLPHYQVEKGETEASVFAREAKAGLDRRLEILFPDEDVRAAQRGEYDARLNHEIDVISRMEFAGYYMIVADFVRFAKDQGIAVGPGRGSGVGSVAAYALGITGVDPIPNGLLFERFLNIERKSMPDFDIDFCIDRRDEVVDYLRRKYGAESVSRVAAVGMIKARSAVQKACRVLEVHNRDAMSITRLIKDGPNVTLDDALSESAELSRILDSTPIFRKVASLAFQMEGLPAVIGKHASGVLVAPGRLKDFLPLYTPSPTDEVISMLDKDDAEAAGMVKFDLLSLATMTAVQDMQNRINQRPEFADKKLNFDTLPPNDPKAYELLASGNAVGLFQVESKGMRNLLTQFNPSNLADITALISLYRPGPMDLIPDFIAMRNGEAPVEYPHAALEPILRETMGIAVYQEQVMQIAQVMGGYTLGRADNLRRAMGKKKKEVMAKEREAFVAGAVANTTLPVEGKPGEFHVFTEEKANEVFDFMERFAEYGFNKSHAAAYATICYWTAWAKAHYPVEFYTAMLNIHRDSPDKMAPMMEDARANGVEILQPDINKSHALFAVEKVVGDDGVEREAVRYGLGAVKSVGAAAERLVQIRNRFGEFESYADLRRKAVMSVGAASKTAISKTVFSQLCVCGALDPLGVREDIKAAIEYKEAEKYINKIKKAATSAGASLIPGVLLGSGDADQMSAMKAVPEPEWPKDAPRWTEVETLNAEFKAFGMYFNADPAAAIIRSMGGLPSARELSDLGDQDVDSVVLVAGSVREIRTNKSKKGEMAHLTISDGSGVTRDITLFAEQWAQFKGRVKVGNFIVSHAKVQADRRGEDYPVQMTAQEFFTEAEAREKIADRVTIECSSATLRSIEPVIRKAEKELAEGDKKAPGMGITVVMSQTPTSEFRYRGTLPFRVRASAEVLDALTQTLGADAVKVEYRAKFPEYKPQFTRKPNGGQGGNRGRNYSKSQ